jgi:hydroxylysine kinase
MLASDLDAFMATMVAPSLAVSREDAEWLAHERYGLDVSTVAKLTGERDENFKLSCGDGREYVLKIASAAEPPLITDLPTAALLHVEEVDPGFPCPRVLRSRDGLTQSRWEDASGSPRTVRVLTYLRGKTLRSSVRSSEQRAGCGRLAARLGLALRSFTHAASERPLIWDLRHVGRAIALLEEMRGFPEKAAASTLMSGVDARIQAEFGQLRQQVIHNDMNDMNLLVDPDDEKVVAGVIDFGDLVHTALVADLAILAADQIAAGGVLRDSIADVVMPYHDVAPLLPQELAMLNPLIAGRILTDVVIASWHRQRNPAGTHYADLDPEFVRGRVELAAEVMALAGVSLERLAADGRSPGITS